VFVAGDTGVGSHVTTQIFLFLHPGGFVAQCDFESGRQKGAHLSLVPVLKFVSASTMVSTSYSPHIFR